MKAMLWLFAIAMLLQAVASILGIVNFFIR